MTAPLSMRRFLLTFRGFSVYTPDMRPVLRTVLFFLVIALIALLAVAAGLVAAVLFSSPDARSALRSLPDHPWWFVHRQQRGGASDPLWGVAASIAAIAAAVVAMLHARPLLRGGMNPVALFFFAFLLSLGGETLRAAIAWLIATEHSVAVAVALTRVVHAGRFLGLLSLLVANFYCLGLRYERHLVLLGIVFLVSFGMAVSIPVDSTLFLGQLTAKLGDELAVWFVHIVLGVLVLGASAAASLARKRPRCLLVACGSALLIAGRELLVFPLAPVLLLCGLACLSAGVFVILRQLLQQHGEMEGAQS